MFWGLTRFGNLRFGGGIPALEQNQSRCTLPHVRKNKDQIQGSFLFAALEGQDDDFKK
jgi:hypothetical protein